MGQNKFGVKFIKQDKINKQNLSFKKLTCLKKERKSLIVQKSLKLNKRIQSSQIEKRATADQPRIHNVIFNKISNQIFIVLCDMVVVDLKTKNL